MSTELSKMVELTDAELDAVAAGLVNVVAFDVVDVRNVDVLNNNDVQLNLPVAAAVAVLGAAGAITGNRPGRVG